MSFEFLSPYQCDLRIFSLQSYRSPILVIFFRVADTTNPLITIYWLGETSYVDQQEKTVYEIAGKHGGMPAGEENGQRGYMLTFVIAYLR